MSDGRITIVLTLVAPKYRPNFRPSKKANIVGRDVR
jgi:hypothetical protein